MTNSFRLLVLFLMALSVSTVVTAQRPFRLQQGYFSGLSSPVFLTNAGDGTRRIFIVQQGGAIKVARPGSSTTSDYLSITVASGGERGLLGLAFHPQFEFNRRFFVYYTRQPDGAIEIAEYEQSAANPNIANPTAIRTIITIPHPGQSNHNGGTIAFGPDGYLYAAPGDGGSGNDPPNNAQNIESLLGKMLRLDINTPVGQAPAYNIPPTNPYVGVAGRDEIYAIGLRNPYRFSFDRGGTNQLWVGDVGQGSIEEVDIVTLGGNYGWRVYEGTQCTGLDPNLCSTGPTPISHTPPVFQYSSASPSSRCSITGGNVYRGKQNALPVGSYVYADFCTGEILLWHQNQQTLLQNTSDNNLSGFGEDEDGELYVVRLNGNVDKIAGVRTNADFDGDGGSDYSVFRTTNGDWFSLSPLNNSIVTAAWGFGDDIPVPDDYDGDGKTDHAVFRQSTGAWYYLRSSNFTLGSAFWGFGTDIPSPGDFDGDGRADINIYRPGAQGVWYTLRSIDGGFSAFSFGAAEDIPLNGDYDGDGRDDIVVYRPSQGAWFGSNSSNGEFWGVQFGAATDRPVPGDYDGDGRLDLAVFRLDEGVWYALRSSDSVVQATAWGFPDDIPVAGDYDRDNRDDIAVFRPSVGAWFALGSASGQLMAASWGISADSPIARHDKP